MLRRMALLVLIAAGTWSTGCTTAVKQAYYGVTGATGSYYELDILDVGQLAGYRSITVESFGNDLGDHLPQEVIDQINEQVFQTIQEENLFYSEGKRLRIAGSITHFTGKSGLEGSISNILGGEVCVCRVQLIDDETGERVAEGMCWSAVKSAVRRGAKEFGVGVGKGIAKWLEDRLGDEEADRRKKELRPQ